MYHIEHSRALKSTISHRFVVEIPLNASVVARASAVGICSELLSVGMMHIPF
jgi:hypothetical protein